MADPPAFAGAEGAGANAIGSRGGSVCAVTNLNDSGTGSLRACIEQSGARIVVFRVGGTIELQTSLVFLNPDIYIAGHTAPGGGIQISGKNMQSSVMRINTDNVVLRYLRIRKGLSPDPNPSTPDVVGIEYTTTAGADAPTDIILDHLSMMWSHDEAFSAYGETTGSTHVPKDITVQYSIMAEGLMGHSTNALTGSDSATNAQNMTNIDFHHNLFANVTNRNPLIKSRSGRVVNNIVYNWMTYASQSGPGSQVDYIANLYKAGPIIKSANRAAEVQVFLYNASTCSSAGLMQLSPSIYIAGNKGPWFTTPDDDNWAMIKQVTCENGTVVGALSTDYKRADPLATAGVAITVEDVDDIETTLLPVVGASRRLDCDGTWVSARDTADTRLVAEYTAGRGFIPSNENEVGGFPVIASGTACTDTDGDGMPDVWEDAQSLNKNSAADGPTIHASGYSNLERYLNGP
jgi:pectate lyase